MAQAVPECLPWLDRSTLSFDGARIDTQTSVGGACGGDDTHIHTYIHYIHHAQVFHAIPQGLGGSVKLDQWVAVLAFSYFGLKTLKVRRLSCLVLSSERA